MSQSHLEIFNPGTNVAGLSSFTQIIKIYLRSHISYCANRTKHGIQFPLLELGDNDPPYYPVVEGHQLLSKLLRVNVESREAVLSFYRVHLPCWLTGGVSKDRLWVSGTQDKMAIVDFVCELKTKHDPRNLGGSAHGLHTIESSGIEPSKMHTFKEIINGLDEIWFIFIQSFPISAASPSFDRIGPDPRTVENDLSHLHVLDPNDVKPTEERYRVLLAFKPHCKGIYNLKDAEYWLQKEDRRWMAKSIGRMPASETPGFRDEDLDKAVKPAFGFWLFPVDAFSDENKSAELQELSTIVTFDVRKHRPELVLLRINE
ncbi:uncharacterized protein BKA55DRAFT_663084 [Fusarium redolens]|uniref:Uncharacterized protein n=1 Tax=Fusarium redolens TaxID=48865 RepID=A0A9P9K8V6_FUSRE|nr:uncharacterized protein BKA55DRAFT_663084 [Fusarium redolens]KAH7253632.1 hypothetical protein BKA55DRAFT_663084 [Fusarium redolens]